MFTAILLVLAIIGVIVLTGIFFVANEELFGCFSIFANINLLEGACKLLGLLLEALVAALTGNNN